MKWKSTFIPSPPHLLVEFEGEFDLAETLKMHEHLAGDEHVLTGAPILMDCRPLTTFSISADDIEVIARSFASYAVSFARTRFAFLIASNVHFGLGRQLQGNMGEQALGIALLRTEEEAEAWLRQEPSK